MNSAANFAEERLRIARELHDGIAQEVAALGYRLDELIGRTETTAGNRKSLREIRISVTNLGSSIRDEIFLLRNQEPRSLNELIESLGLEIFHDTNIKLEIRSNYERTGNSISEVTKIIQEALINIKIHSGADQVTVVINENGIKVSDNGKMLEREASNAWGIVGMKERAAKLGYGFALTFGKHGTTIEVTW